MTRGYEGRAGNCNELISSENERALIMMVKPLSRIIAGTLGAVVDVGRIS